MGMVTRKCTSRRIGIVGFFRPHLALFEKRASTSGSRLPVATDLRGDLQDRPKLLQLSQACDRCESGIRYHQSENQPRLRAEVCVFVRFLSKRMLRHDSVVVFYLSFSFAFISNPF